MPFVLLVISLVFSVLTFMPKAAEVLYRRSTTEASSASFPARPSMSLAKRKLVIVLPPTADCSLVIRVSVIIFSTKKLKKDGESKHPCLTPTEVLDQSIKVGCRVAALLQRFSIRLALMLTFQIERINLIQKRFNYVVCFKKRK